MAQNETSSGALLAHHEQLPLCSTRPAYRQGRRLTAVKVYTIANESNHILIFGVPALKLRQETKALFVKFGKLVKFNISPQHPYEPFTETYHAQYENIQSARLAKRMLDTKSFYGGLLHVCYAPELETIEETREKLMQRQIDVTKRLWNLKRTDTEPEKTVAAVSDTNDKVKESKKLDMGRVNVITFGDKVKSKRKKEVTTKVKKFKLPATEDGVQYRRSSRPDDKADNEKIADPSVVIQKDPVINRPAPSEVPVEVVDCTSADSEVITNINEHLNYDKFGSEQVRRVATKPVNRIVFCLNKKN